MGPQGLTQTLLLALLGGAAQVLPVSGSAHRLLFPWILQWNNSPPEAALLWGGTLALLLHAWRERSVLSSGLLRGVLLAALPAALSWLALKGSPALQKQECVALALILFGLLLLAADRKGRMSRGLEELGPRDYAALALAQVLAAAPGVSLIGVSMTAGLLLGLRRVEAARLAALAAAPLLLAAALWSSRGLGGAGLGLPFWTALLLSTAAGFGALRLLLRWLENRDLGVFGLYRVGLGLLVLLLATAQPPVNMASKLKLSPPPRKAVSELSPRAARLRRHVTALAGDIGERAAIRPGQRKLNQARDYVARQFEACGYAPSLEPYHALWMGAVKNGTTFYNVAVTLGDQDAEGLWVLGAHYDTTSDTPGADDNASGTAVLLELACALKRSPPKRPVRLVAYSTEEPPAFDTLNMGSAHDAKALKARGAKVEGMISLEMLGYFDDRPGSQLWFPFLKWIIPERGDFLALVANRRSWAFWRTVRRSWRRHSGLPLLPLVMPELAAVRTSDHQGYWDAGFPALMLTDSASYRNPNYHEQSDLPDTLDYEAMGKAADALEAVLRD
ncbi:MAG TPA: hypothetical protein DCM05_06450 [Elusimicrobia bacterium]|nr:hypothetical protein [Elusimicrobiota bacterium]